MTEHRVYVSYDHNEDCGSAAEMLQFCERAGLKVVSRPMDAEVTFVLVGPRTCACTSVNQEIGESLREGQSGSPNGLIGVLLDFHGSLPTRLADNVCSPLVLEPALSPDDAGYALMTTWDNLLPPSSWQFGIVPESRIDEHVAFAQQLVDRAIAAKSAKKPLCGNHMTISGVEYPKNWWL